MVNETTTRLKKELRWTPLLIKRLRGKRTLAEFGSLLGAPKNTVWRWEAGRSQPDQTYVERLSDLAGRERFLKNWKLAGSMTLLADLESAQTEIAAMFRRSLERTARQLAD